MTQRPWRSSPDHDLDDAVGRILPLERQVSGRWIYVGAFPGDPDTTLDSPPFENGWANQGGDLQRLRFRYLIGGGLEIQGSVTGGVTGTTVFTLPDDVQRYRPDEGELRRPASDDVGGFVVYRILVDGQVKHGI